MQQSVHEVFCLLVLLSPEKTKSLKSALLLSSLYDPGDRCYELIKNVYVCINILHKCLHALIVTE